MLQSGTQFPIDNKECANVAQNGDPICKPAGKYKTHLCAKFKLGHCSYGSKCLFAHGIGEIRRRLPSGPLRMRKQSRICRMLYLGKECKNGEKCDFLHANGETSKPWVKRRLCYRWESTGSCLFYDTCLFAHGQAELERPGCHIALASGSIQTTTTRSLSTGKAGIWNTRNQQVQDRKFISKSKAIQKLAGIYADWI